MEEVEIQLLICVYEYPNPKPSLKGFWENEIIIILSYIVLVLTLLEMAIEH